MLCKSIHVQGDVIDSETRCKHYHTDKDIIAIKFYCCHTYYPCFQCHDAHADHPAEVWPKEKFNEKAILCGACGTEHTITEYQTCKSTCPTCKASFNPGCSLHYHLYFEA